MISGRSAPVVSFGFQRYPLTFNPSLMYLKCRHSNPAYARRRSHWRRSRSQLLSFSRVVIVNPSRFAASTSSAYACCERCTYWLYEVTVFAGQATFSTIVPSGFDWPKTDGLNSNSRRGEMDRRIV